MDDFLGIMVVGTGLSLVVEMIRQRLGPDSQRTKLITIGLSVLVGTGYYLLRDTVLWQTILGILMAASTVYAFFIKKSAS